MEGGQSPTVTTTITLWFCSRNPIGSRAAVKPEIIVSRQPFYLKERLVPPVRFDKQFWRILLDNGLNLGATIRRSRNQTVPAASLTGTCRTRPTAHTRLPAPPIRFLAPTRELRESLVQQGTGRYRFNKTGARLIVQKPTCGKLAGETGRRLECAVRNHVDSAGSLDPHFPTEDQQLSGSGTGRFSAHGN